MTQKLLKSQKGFGLVEALVAVGIITAIIGASLLIMTRMLNATSANVQKGAFGVLQNKLMVLISDQKAWDVTKAKNPAMACSRTYPSSCVNGVQADVALYDGRENLLTNPTNTSFGFRADGSTCTDFGPSSAACHYRANVKWSIHCLTPAACKYPEERIAINFEYVGSENINVSSFNILPRSRANLSDNQSPVVSCSKANKVFVGFGEELKDGDGRRFASDSEGCVPMAALRGPSGAMGPSGPQGPQGPQGLQGPQGPNGRVIYPDGTVTGGDPNPPPSLPPGEDPPGTCKPDLHTGILCFTRSVCPASSSRPNEVVHEGPQGPTGYYDVKGAPGDTTIITQEHVHFVDPNIEITRWDPYSGTCDTDGSGSWKQGTLGLGYCEVNMHLGAGDERCN